MTGPKSGSVDVLKNIMSESVTTHSPIDNRAFNARAGKKYMFPDLGRGKRRCA